jgi:T5SS/PEP-CTERM-associated repeat protein
VARHIPVIVALLTSLALPARAEDYSWSAPDGGAFRSAPNWQPYQPIPPGVLLGPGGVDDSVHFDLGVLPADRYTVADVRGANHEMLVHGDSLRLEFSHDYLLPSLESAALNFIVGVEAGDVADVVLTGMNGALFQTRRVHLGDVAGSSGTVFATGSEWVWDVGHQLMVGWNGTGELTIEAGADVASGTPLIGAFDGSIGTVDVRDIGSSWTTAGRISVGVSGTAAMSIEAGGVVSSLSGIIGNSLDSLGIATIRGDGSVWDMTTTLFVAYSGTGQLAIKDGGRVTGGDAWLGGWGDEAFGTGTAVVRGEGSSWLLEADCPACDGGLTVGVSGAATLTIENGGQVADVDGWIGLNPDSSGTALVRGRGARWDHTGQLFVGDRGTGTLAIEAGGGVASLDGWIGFNADSIGMATVHGARSHWGTGLLFVGSQGAGTLRIEAGGGVASDAAWLGFLVCSTGAVTVTGVGSSWVVRGALRVGYASDGTLAIETRGEVASGSGDVAATFGSNSDATVSGAGSTWENTGDLAIGRAGIGSLTIDDAGSVSCADGTIGDRGTVRVGAGSTWTLAGSLDVEEEEDRTGTLAIGISGPAQHGLVIVAGTAQLAGDFEPILQEGFVPAAEDTFAVLNAGIAITGAFDNVANGSRVDAPDGGGSFLVHYGPASAADPNHVVLTDFVPEPDAASMALAAQLALWLLRRRRPCSRRAALRARA